MPRWTWVLLSSRCLGPFQAPVALSTAAVLHPKGRCFSVADERYRKMHDKHMLTVPGPRWKAGASRGKEWPWLLEGGGGVENNKPRGSLLAEGDLKYLSTLASNEGGKEPGPRVNRSCSRNLYLSRAACIRRPPCRLVHRSLLGFAGPFSSTGAAMKVHFHQVPKQSRLPEVKRYGKMGRETWLQRAWPFFSSPRNLKR